MNKSELIERLLSIDADEVYVLDGDYEYDIELEEHDDMFDGFDTVYPARITLRASKAEKEKNGML